MSVRKKMTVVVGAGASADLGFPLGSELKGKISPLLNIKYRNGSDLTSGDFDICEALGHYASETIGRRDINCFLPVARHISAAMPQAISIDNFIDCAKGLEHVEICGKLAIAKAILQAEKRSSIYLGSSRSSIDFSTTERSWLNPFVRILTENCTKDEIAQRLAHLSIINFNYDRSAEWYLYHWLRGYYDFDQGSARELVREIAIYHPYGVVGALPGMGAGQAIEFGGEPDSKTLLSVAKQIKTFTEGTDESSSEIADLRQAIRSSETVVFLGFAYHELNMSLLASPLVGSDCVGKVFGTAYGLSNSDTELVRQDILRILPVAQHNIILRNELKCNALFSEYSRSLRWPRD